MTKKCIYTAIAAPGAGKTQAVVNKIPDYINNGFKVVMALPTLKLNDDILKTMKKANLTPLIINSDQDEIKHNKTSVTRVLAQVLKSKAHPLIIITHDALRRTDPILFKGYILIIDEIPEIMDINHFTLKSKEAETIFATTEAFNNQLQIKDGLLTEITARVKTYKSSMSNKDNASTLSAVEHKIYDTILTGNIVLFETEKGGIINFHTIVEKSVFAQIDRARETHILAANIDGGLFDLFAKKLGYKYTRSKLTPEPSKYNCPIYIYPMLNGSWSADEKTKAINFIKHGFNNGFKQADINKAVMELWKVAERTARTWTKNVRESLPVKPVEGLEQFFV